MKRNTSIHVSGLNAKPVEQTLFMAIILTTLDLLKPLDGCTDFTAKRSTRNNEESSSNNIRFPLRPLTSIHNDDNLTSNTPPDLRSRSETQTEESTSGTGHEPTYDRRLQALIIGDYVQYLHMI
ncbi:hypothetical protein GWI33_005164 [Rhynchophorus ferrugineus]|uniref:Uncharacterized protein n=1 Tax=Rhynchophorus ferrugineus TaxID=354439 RepID=A0A834IKM8_RHYFE|nr:hypothetical protein GWI33_005164 [Rhynchophorus ferrugineus]